MAKKRTNGKDKSFKRVTMLKSIEVKLSALEVVERAQKAASHQEVIDTLTEQLLDLKLKLKPQVDTAKRELHRLLEIILNGKEERTLEVEMVKDFGTNTVSYFYEGKVVEERAMSAEDRQQEFEIEDQPEQVRVNVNIDTGEMTEEVVE